MEIISRKEAKERGLRYYFTGNSCKRGHICKRYVSTYTCYECDNERNTSIGITEERRKWRNNYQIEWVNRPENKERYLKKNRSCNMSSEQLELKRARQRKENLKDWRILANRHNSRRLDAKRLLRVPKWAQLNEIKQFYLNCPLNHHVDHIVPLCGRLVSGLHVLENLQYLPASENLKKGNSYEVK